MLSALVLLGLVELGLRLAGYGFPSNFFLRSQIDGARVLVENDKFGYRFFPPAVARPPTPFAIADPKPPGTYRIYVLGESAALGDPEPGFGFSRMLAVLLRARYPSTRFEVVNLAMTAINSHGILSIARDCAKHDGDLWILYMGNNEVHGPFGAGSAFGWQAAPRPLVRAVLALTSLRLGQAIGALGRFLQPASRARTSWQGVQMFLDHQVGAQEPRLERVYSSFESNLEDILRAGTRAGVAQVVCSVGVNLKDMPPLGSRHGPGFTSANAESWQRTFEAGIGAEGAERFADALKAYGQAAELDPEYAELHFRRAQCLAALGRYEEAQSGYEKARDLDTLRFRADRRLNQLIARHAQARSQEAIHFIDVAGLLVTNSMHGLVGDGWFCDHVHFAPTGNFLVAEALANQIATVLPQTISLGAVSNRWLSREECLRRLGWNDWNLYRALRDIQQRMLQPPFSQQRDHAERDARLQSQVASLIPAIQPSTLRPCAEALRAALEATPDDPILHDRLAGVLAQSEDFAGALKEWKAVIRLLPHHPTTYHNLGRLLCRSGKFAEAETYFAAELRLDPDEVQAMEGLGQAMLGQNRFPEAVRFYKRALRLRPDSPRIRAELATALQKTGSRTVEPEPGNASSTTNSP